MLLNTGSEKFRDTVELSSDTAHIYAKWDAHFAAGLKEAVETERMIDADYDSSDKPFLTVNIDTDEIDLVDLHAQVLRRYGRVELVRNGEACILVSKPELDSLEKALEILSDNDTVRAIRNQIAMMAQFTGAEPAREAPMWGADRSINP